MRAHYIGVMSGTSLDSVDAVLAAIDARGLAIVDHQTRPLPAELRAEARDLVSNDDDGLNRAMRLGNRVTAEYRDCVGELARRNRTLEIAAIGCHGQTLRHFPDATPPFTIQVVNGAALAIGAGITTVTDFRSGDMALGGQGAPLAAGLHDAVFRHAARDRVILNLGGIANVTFLPARRARPVTGFDTGPANALLDHWIERRLELPFDRDGDWAASGRVDEELLERMLRDPYFSKPPPKSTGREYFGRDWLNARLDGFARLAANDVQATLAELTAASIADAVERFCAGAREVFACGGGCRNGYLLERIARRLPACAVSTTERLGLPPSLVEAAAFAWLARRRVEGLSGNLPSVTGARRACVLGAIYAP